MKNGTYTNWMGQTVEIHDGHQIILCAMQQINIRSMSGALVSTAEVIRSLRHMGVANVKQRMIDLCAAEICCLHQHDWPASLTRVERAMMIRIRDEYFVGIALSKSDSSFTNSQAI